MDKSARATLLRKTLNEYASREIPDELDLWGSMQERIVAIKTGQHTDEQLERGARTNGSGTPRFAHDEPEYAPKGSAGPVGLAQAKKTGQTRRFSWSLAIAATAILALGGLVVGFLSLGEGLAGGNLFGQKEQVIFSEGFENGLAQWNFTEGQPQQYKEGIDNGTSHSGKASTFIESAVDEPNNFAYRSRGIDAKDYLDKRIRFSAYVKTNSDDLAASLGMHILGAPMPREAGQQGDRMKVLGKDNMVDRLIRGRKDWQRYDIVLDVPPDAKNIYIYFQVEGKGRVWFDDLTLSVADGNVPVTNMYRFADVGNSGFEQQLARWGISSSMSRAYELGIDRETKYDGNASGVISSTFRMRSSFYLTQFVNTADYKGKRVRLSAQIKTENVEDKATLWIGVRDLADFPMSPDTVGTDSKSGTTDWQEYQAGINVPDDSLSFLILIGLQGGGKMWIDDVKLEVVGDFVPPAIVKP